jgi:hypothetical protein
MTYNASTGEATGYRLVAAAPVDPNKGNAKGQGGDETDESGADQYGYAGSGGGGLGTGDGDGAGFPWIVVLLAAAVGLAFVVGGDDDRR